MICINCGRETKETGGFCSKDCKLKHQAKEENVFIQQGAIAKSKPMSPREIALQEEFLRRRVG